MTQRDGAMREHVWEEHILASLRDINGKIDKSSDSIGGKIDKTNTALNEMERRIIEKHAVDLTTLEAKLDEKIKEVDGKLEDNVKELSKKINSNWKSLTENKMKIGTAWVGFVLLVEYLGGYLHNFIAGGKP